MLTALRDKTNVSIPWLLLIALVVYYLVSTFLSWRRLSCFPGPRLASLSYAWLTYVVLSGKFDKLIGQQNRKYGGRIVRVGPNELLTDDPVILERMSTARSPYRRSAMYSTLRILPNNDDLLTELDTVKHDIVKAKVASGFAGKGDMNLERTVDRQVVEFINIIRTRYVSSGTRTKAMNFAKIAQYFTTDVISAITYGQPWGYMQTENDEYMVLHTLETVTPLVNSPGVNPYIRSLYRFLMSWLGPRPTAEKGMGKFLETVKTTVAEHFHRESGSDKTKDGDIIDEFIRNGLTQENCEKMVPLVLPAGSKTVAVSLRGLVLNVVASPPVYRTIKDEIRQGIKHGTISEPITAEEAKSLPYLQVVIYETLRINPPTTILFGREGPPQGDRIDGIFIPGGTIIYHNTVSLLRSTIVFGEDADVFRPERFLERSESEKQEMFRHVELVFGYGRWICSGKNIAFLEIGKVVELFRAFDLQLLNVERPWRMISYRGTNLIKDFWLRVPEDVRY